MRVAVPMVGAGVIGDPQRPEHILHGQMHYDLANRTVVFTDSSFTEEELALPGVVVLDGTMDLRTSLKPEEVRKVKTENAEQPGVLRRRRQRGGKHGNRT